MVPERKDIGLSFSLGAGQTFGVGEVGPKKGGSPDGDKCYLID